MMSRGNERSNEASLRDGKEHENLNIEWLDERPATLHRATSIFSHLDVENILCSHVVPGLASPDPTGLQS